MDVQDHVMSLAYYGSSFMIIFGGVFPYIPQYLTIVKSKSADGFSPYVCFTLLLANILRIAFWVGKPFSMPLLYQSIIMIVCMLIMMRIVVLTKNKILDPPLSTPGKNIKTLTDFKYEDFWLWTDFLSYIQFTIMSLIVFCGTANLMKNSSLFIETLGFMAVFTEAMLGSPQVLRNYRNKSTKGMSLSMVGMWFSGDVFKCVYFVSQSAPIQFLLCGLLQIGMDVIILCQYFYYDQPADT